MILLKISKQVRSKSTVPRWLPTQLHSQVLQNVLKRLDGAFDRFFERVKKGETPGYPRFKGRNRYNSFTYVRHEVAPFERPATLGAGPG